MATQETFNALSGAPPTEQANAIPGQSASAPAAPMIRPLVFAATLPGDAKTYVIPAVWNGEVVPPEQALGLAQQHGLDKFPEMPQGSTAGLSKLAGDVVDMTGAMHRSHEKAVEADPDYFKKLGTRDTLMRALGGGATVLPMMPAEKK